MDSHSTLNELKFPRSDWGLRYGAFLALILCTISFVGVLANPGTIIASPAGFVSSIVLSCLIGAAFGFAIQRWIARRNEREAEEIRELRRREADRQLLELREAKQK